ncbi:hypothetical protein Tco_1319059 [Tanacetum coccineum]
MAALKYKDDHNKIAYLGRERGCEDFTDILSYLDQSSLRYALTHDPPIVFDSLVKQFWATAVVRPNAAGSHDLVAIIDGREVVVMRNLIKNQWCAAHNGTITTNDIKAMNKQQLIEEYEYICRRLEKDRLLSAQFNLFRPKPAIAEPPSKRQRVEHVSSQPASVPAAPTLPADDPDSVGSGSSNPAGSATPMAGSAASNTAGGAFGATVTDSTVTTTATMDSAGSHRKIGVSPFADSVADPLPFLSSIAGGPSPSHVSTDQIPVAVLFESTSGDLTEFFLESDEEEQIEWVVPNPVSPVTDWRPWSYVPVHSPIRDPSPEPESPPTPPAPSLHFETIYPYPKDDIDLDGLSRMASTALGHDQPAVPSEDVEEQEEEEVPLRRKRSAYRRARTEFSTPAFEQFQANLSADVLPHNSKDAQARKCFEEEQASERLVQRLRAEDLAQEDLPNVSEERAKELDDLMMRMTETDWLNLMMQVGSNPALARELLGADVNEENFIERMNAVKEKKKRALERFTINGVQLRMVTITMKDTTSVPAATTLPADDPDSAGVVVLILQVQRLLWLALLLQYCWCAFVPQLLTLSITTTALRILHVSWPSIGVSPFADSAADPSPFISSIAGGPLAPPITLTRMIKCLPEIILGEVISGDGVCVYEELASPQSKRLQVKTCQTHCMAVTFAKTVRDSNSPLISTSEKLELFFVTPGCFQRLEAAVSDDVATII